jgi:hypothetical protein
LYLISREFRRAYAKKFPVFSESSCYYDEIRRDSFVYPWIIIRKDKKTTGRGTLRKKCEKQELNLRTPTGTDLESASVDHLDILAQE